MIFRSQDIKKIAPSFDKKALIRWQQKGYIQKIRNTFYHFNDVERDECFLYLGGNRIYTPSYISLETALSYYNLIPEATFTITSVTTLKTNLFQTSLATFSYRHIKPQLFFGFQLMTYNNQTIKIATLEKTLLDYLYFNHPLGTQEAISTLRLNKAILKTSIQYSRFDTYLNLFQSPGLNRRAQTLLQYIHA